MQNISHLAWFASAWSLWIDRKFGLDQYWGDDPAVNDCWRRASGHSGDPGGRGSGDLEISTEVNCFRVDVG